MKEKMSRKRRDGLEPDVIVSTLKHSSIPTLLVEGTGDVELYRCLEELLGIGNIDVLQCGGRPELFSIYSRRGEFTGTPVVFLADLDDYLYFGVDSTYREIIFTNGYSIENDVMSASDISFIFDTSESQDFTNALERMLEIYSSKLHLRKSNPSEDLDIHPAAYYDFDNSCFKESDPFVSYSKNQSWYEHISNNPKVLMRGKNVLNLYTAILSRRTRRSKYSGYNILELHLKKGALPIPIARTLIKIKIKFRALGVAI